MAHYAVRESPPLRGEIQVSTSKNAVLPIMCAALLTREDVRIEHPPDLTDVHTLASLLGACAFRIFWVVTIFAAAPSMTSLMVSYPVSWALTFVVLVAIFVMLWKRIRAQYTPQELAER